MDNTARSNQEQHAAAAAPAASFEEVKGRQRATWASGDFGIIGTTLQIVGESLCESIDLRAGSTVLDVAAGNGNCSLAAARRWCDVTCTDYVPGLLNDARRRAAGERLRLNFEEADAEALPFPDGSFDVVLSSFGVMFTPDHVRAANELMRVCRSGGRVGLANWTRHGFIGQLFATVGWHVTPPAGLTPAFEWGSENYLRTLFPHAASLEVTPRDFIFRYRSADHWIEAFRNWYGPVHKAFAALPADGQRALYDDVVDLIHAFNRSGDSTAVIPGEYVEVVIVKH
jgi:ubiquinone/menaquinone biosynthesis C-methylase UbiE